MKQSILFENGKLYVVELPNYNYGKYSHSETKDFDEGTDKAFANKVEVKNPEVIPGLLESVNRTSWMLTMPQDKILKDGDTFPLPDGIEVEIKKEVCESCPWDLECAQRCPDKIKYAVLKRIEPEKPEEVPVICLKCKEVWNSRPIGEECMCGGKTFQKTHPSNAKPALPEGLHNGMTAQQVYEWLDKRCMFEPHQKDYVLLIIKLIINAKLST